MMRARAGGTTLIELIVSIVIISVATFGLMLAISGVVARSADPMIENQAGAIAEAYLEEALLANFCDPDFVAASGACRAVCTTSVCGGGCGAAATHREASRALYDDICDYDQITNAAPADRNGDPVGDLARYSVNVDVIDSGITLGPTPLSANAGQVARVEVSVTHPALDTPIRLSGHRANSQ